MNVSVANRRRFPKLAARASPEPQRWSIEDRKRRTGGGARSTSPLRMLNSTQTSSFAGSDYTDATHVLAESRLPKGKDL